MMVVNVNLKLFIYQYVSVDRNKKSDINNVTMYRNGWSMREIKQISSFIYKLQNEVEIECLLKELLTNSEINVLSKRWRILELINKGRTQRDIAKELKVSLCKVTRGAKLLKNSDTVIHKYLKKDKTDDENTTETKRFFWKLRRSIY